MKAHESCPCGAEITLEGKGEYRIVSELEDFRLAHNLCRTGRVAERAEGACQAGRMGGVPDATKMTWKPGDPMTDPAVSRPPEAAPSAHADQGPPRASGEPPSGEDDLPQGKP
jgi:hypothetical protein